MLGNKNIVDNYALGINNIFNDGGWEPYYDEPQSISLPNATSIGDYAFASCSSLTSISIPNMTTIGEGAFEGCGGLTSLTIPNSVTSIGGNAFRGCDALTSVTIPDSVTSIGEDAFDGCYELTIITFQGKTIAQVQEMDNYPWGIDDVSIINVA